MFQGQGSWEVSQFFFIIIRLFVLKTTIYTLNGSYAAGTT